MEVFITTAQLTITIIGLFGTFITAAAGAWRSFNNAKQIANNHAETSQKLDVLTRHVQLQGPSSSD